MYYPLFGLDITPTAIPVLGVGWDLTTSYRTGTAHAPDRIAAATTQVDLHHPYFETRIATQGVTYSPAPVQSIYNAHYNVARDYIRHKTETPDSQTISPDSLNQACQAADDIICDQVTQLLAKHRKFGVLGGDHSITGGVIRALNEHHADPFGIVQIDAHMDLRPAYQDLPYSHASVMARCLNYPAVSHLIQIGVRDYSSEEYAMAQTNGVTLFRDRDIMHHLANGRSWHALCHEIIAACPARVYLSLDCDGLTPSLFPDTGTPVPGGLSYQQLLYLLYQLHQSNREIIGFDLVEIAGEPDSIGIINGAHLLYTLCGLLTI